MMDQAMTLERRTVPETCLSDLVLDRLSVGELEGTELGRHAREHLGRCAMCATRAKALEVNAAAFEREIFVSGMALKTERAVRKSPLRWIASAGAIAAAFLGVILVRGTASDGIRTKGGLNLGVVARHLDGKTEQILPGATLRPGEAIRFEVSAREKGYLIITGIDAAKNVTTYFPAGPSAEMVAPSVGRILDGSVTLDRTLGHERIFALLCDHPIDAAEIQARGREALDRAGGDPAKIERLDSGCVESSFPIEKVAGE